ncbi:hypothetical protein, partial [Parasutterella excrementihominis]|uniref:hypothetical protein n=1 Tax=Parasutterella excrementihominis TaxID=487175 RepID=UPI00272EC6B1
FSLSRRRAFAGEQGISGFPRLFQTNTLKFVSSVFRPVVILRQCWKGFQADSTAPTSQSF